MKTTTKLRLFSLSGKHVYSKQDAILVFNPRAHHVLKLQTNKNQSFLNAQEQQQKKKLMLLLHIWKIMLKTSQLGGY